MAPLGILSFADLVHAARRECISAHKLWSNLMILYGTPETVSLLDRSARGFFANVQRVFANEVILILARLTDPQHSAGKPNASLERIIAEYEARGSAPDPELHEKFRVLRASVEDVRELRNRRVAHRDLLTLQQQHPKPLQVPTVEQVRGALAHLADLLNTIEQRLGWEEIAYASVTQDGDAAALLERLRSAENVRADDGLGHAS